ncbi:MAG: PHP domain-containing protein [Cyanobacteria bacterium P01_C01_bin.89]
MLELHCHTTFSDGTLTPTELVAEAVQRGVRVLAITDHDTCGGWQEAIAAADTYRPDYDLTIVPGIELSTMHLGRSLHILGFYPDPKTLDGPLLERAAGRWRRAQKMVEILESLGYPIEMPKLPSGAVPGRPHIAQALVNGGHVESVNDAFRSLLGDGKAAYVPYEPFSAEEGIQMLRQCGAVPVWAHAFLFKGDKVGNVLKALVPAGLMGLEVHHPGHSVSDQRQLQEWCDQYDLLATGGSDYHGPGNKHRAGDRTGLNRFELPIELLLPIQKAAAQLKKQPEFASP